MSNQRGHPGPHDENEGSIRAVIDNLPQMMVYQVEAEPGNGARRFTYLSGGVTEIFGYTPEEGLADPMLLYGKFAEEERERLTREEEVSLRECAPFKTEVRLRGKPERWVSLASKPRRRDDGSIIWDGIVIDITERKRAEEDFREAMQRLDTLLEHSPLAIIEWSSDFRIERWTGEAARVFGWTAEEVVGKNIDELNWIHPDDQPIIDQNKVEMVNGRQTRNVTRNRNVRKDGAVIHCEWYNSILHERAGKVSVLSLVLDVTERRRAEEALRQANERLHEVDRAKNEFLATLSHELRNPLTPIKNSLYVFERAAPGGEQAQRAKEVIARQVNHLSRLVDDLLDITRINSNKVHLQSVRLDLNELVHRTVEDHRLLFERSGVRLELSLAPGSVFILGDEARIVQIVGNLLQNAVKFAGPAGFARIGVDVDAQTKRAVLRVSDSGTGIEPEVLPKLFQPFMQAGGLDHGKGGLGLGLALVKSLAELHGGEVGARSAGAGKGAEFTVRLPLAPPVGAGRTPQAAPPRGPSARRVLVIEDNVDLAESLREALAFGDHDIAVAHDGPAGIATARTFQPDIVLCDIGLPRMDGYAVARAFREDDALKGVRLIALSGYARPEDLARAKEAGFDRHVAKPPNLDFLEQLIASQPATSAER